MKLRNLAIGLLAAVATVGAIESTPVLAKDSIFIPVFSYRTGPFAPGGSKVANGYTDYFKLVQKRDGGVEGVEVKFEECEFGYKTDRGVECYERMKGKGSIISHPNSTGLVYKLVPKAPIDEIPILSMGYGMSGAADGRYFPWVFNFPTSYWSQASAFIKYIGTQSGGMDKLKGKKVGLIFLESGYGREPIPLFEKLGKQFGYEFKHWAVPGKQMADQRSQWRKITRWNPDYLFMWGWGVMNPTAVSRAHEFGFPLNKFIGVWWSGDELDTKPSGEKAKGYRAATFHAPGAFADVHKDLLKHVYGGDEAAAKKNSFGDVLYNRGMFNAMLVIEAARTAIKKHGSKITGKEMRWGLENLNLDEKRLAELGMAGFGKPIKVSCADHEGSGPVLFQEWTGSEWKIVSDWVNPMSEIVRPMLETAAETEAKKWNYEKRDCG